MVAQGTSDMQMHRVDVGAEPGARQVAGAAASDTVHATLEAPYAVLVLTRLRPSTIPWAVWRLALGPRGLGRVPGLRFARVLGSGRNGGFGLVPGLDVQGVFAAFDSLDAAQTWADHGQGLQGYSQRAVEHLRLTLRVISSRGSWGGARMSAAPAPSTPAAPPACGGVVAALTRASIRPAQMGAFWRHSPPAERDLARAVGCRLAVGLGEAPLLRQATFSLWNDVDAMNAYARSGAHGEAIRSARGGAYFSESMFVRFVPVRMRGHWPGMALG